MRKMMFALILLLNFIALKVWQMAKRSQINLIPAFMSFCNVIL